MNTAAAQVPRTLIADDQPDVLMALRLLLKGAGYQTEVRTQIEQGQLRRLQKGREAERRMRDGQLRLELEEAHEIQQGLLPHKMPNLRGFNLASAWKPAHGVSGDYLAAFKLNERHAALCVADVAGKRLPAALLMSNMQAALKSFASESISPSELSARLNQLMYGNTPLHKFISCFYSVLEVRSRKLTFTNAGHNPPLLVRRGGECIRLSDGGLVLGAFTDSRYTQGEVQLCSGDKLLMFTDGLTEATHVSGEEFGEDRLRECLVTYQGRSANELRISILNAVTRFCRNNFQDDAALMLVIAE